MKLLTKYESVTQKVLLRIESMLQNAKQLQHARLSWHPPHWAPVFREFLDIHFPGRWVGRGGPIPWPPSSPDITLLGLFL
jgi:hypothetical protein